MAQASVLSPGQFAGKRQKRVDPHRGASSVAFSGDPGSSKTMNVRSGQGLPKAQDKHMHHNRAGRRSHRIS